MSEIIEVRLIMRSGTTEVITSSTTEYHGFVSDLEKHHDGLRARTTSYTLGRVGGRLIVLSEVAMVHAYTTDGNTVRV